MRSDRTNPLERDHNSGACCDWTNPLERDHNSGACCDWTNPLEREHNSGACCDVLTLHVNTTTGHITISCPRHITSFTVDEVWKVNV